MTKIVGHDSARDEVLTAARSGRLHHGWILAGPSGLGKGCLARELALALLAGEEGGGAVAGDHPVARLFESGALPDYAELRRLERENGELARNISVDQVRGLGRLLTTAPSVSRRRVVVIDAADDLERSAANALLKNLEEPPKDVVFLLVSHAPSRLLPTIRSRCRTVRLTPLCDQDMDVALRIAAPEMSESERRELVRIGQGSPGRAMALAGLGVAAMLGTLEQIARTGDTSNTLRLTLVKELSARAARLRFEAFLEQVPAFTAAQARGRPASHLGRAIATWERARDLAAQAIPLSLDPAATVFELCSLVAGLAEDSGATNALA